MTLDAWMQMDCRLTRWEARAFWPDDDQPPPMEPIRQAPPEQSFEGCLNEERWTRKKSKQYHRDFANGWYRLPVIDEDTKDAFSAANALKRHRKILAEMNIRRELDRLLQWQRELLAERARQAAIRDYTFFQPSTNNTDGY